MAAAPSDKERKYDRQLRLWGAHGQRALESAAVLLVSATAAGSEALKNLILPCIGSFTVLDGALVTEADLASNFFVERSRVGTSRAAAVCELLSELNPDVRGAHVAEDPSTVLADQPDFFDAFTVILASDLPRAVLAPLAARAEARGAIVVAIQTAGLFATLRLSPPVTHLVIDSHPDFPRADLRLVAPFAELATALAAEPYETVPDAETGDVPYPFLVRRALEIWWAQLPADAPDAGAAAAGERPLPQRAAEMASYKRILAGLRRHPGDENIQQALDKCALALVRPTISPRVAELFAHEACERLTAATPDEWLVVRAVRDFVASPAGGGLLPHTGAVPDMVASTRRYVALQQLYKERSIRDLHDVYTRVQALLVALGRDPAAISQSSCDRLAKCVADMSALAFSPLSVELTDGPNARTVAVWRDVLSVREYPAPDRNLAIYLLFAAAERFTTELRRRPGAGAGDDFEDDIPLLAKHTADVCVEAGLAPTAVALEWVHEFCRYGSAQLHSTAALIGGVAAQEIIKLVTGQYVPARNTFVFNGIDSSGSVYDL